MIHVFFFCEDAFPFCSRDTHTPVVVPFRRLVFFCIVAMELLFDVSKVKCFSESPKNANNSMWNEITDLFTLAFAGDVFCVKRVRTMALVDSSCTTLGPKHC